MSKPKVVLDPHPRKLDWVFTPADLACLNKMVEVVWGRDEPMPPEEFAKVKHDLFAVITCGWRFGPVDDMTNLHAILEVGGGPPSPEHLDYATLLRRGIRVLSCAPAFGPVVAEMALGLAIASARGIVEGDRLIRQGREQYSRAGNANAFTLYGKPVGLIGFGGLARSLKPLLEPFGCKFFVYDPWLPQRYLEAQGTTPVELDTLLNTCRVIFVLAIPSQENKALLNRERLRLIQPDAILLLISRAHVVDFDALVEMVNEGRFRAAIDVFPTEPLPADHAVRSSSNTILSAHRAGHVPEDFTAIGSMVVDDLAALLNGLPPMQMQVAQPEIVNRLKR
jgi:phosphoglycerate dehydrogenase-like enzyme